MPRIFGAAALCTNTQDSAIISDTSAPTRDLQTLAADIVSRHDARHYSLRLHHRFKRKVIMVSQIVAGPVHHCQLHYSWKVTRTGLCAATTDLQGREQP